MDAAGRHGRLPRVYARKLDRGRFVDRFAATITSVGESCAHDAVVVFVAQVVVRAAIAAVMAV